MENPRTESLFHWRQSVEMEAYSEADWRGDKSTRRSVSAGNDHEWWTLIESMGQLQVVSLSIAESVAAVVIRHVNSEGGKRLGYCM